MSARQEWRDVAAVILQQRHVPMRNCKLFGRVAQMFLQAQRDGASVSLFCVAILSTDGPQASQPRPQTRNNLLQHYGGAPATTSEVLSRDGYGCSKVYGCKASQAFCVCFLIGYDFGEDHGPINAVCWCGSNISNRIMHLFFNLFF